MIARPLGLRRTFVPVGLADAGVLTPGFSTFLGAGDLHDISRVYAPGWVSHGVVISTVVDLARMVDAIFGRRMLSADSMAALLAPTPVPADYPPFRRPAYGLGTMIDAGSPYGVVAGHGGGGPGYSIGAFHFSDVYGRSVTSVAMANRDAGDLVLHLAFELVDVVAAHFAEQG
jgi:D-alanyl-D-alanine carboxypeptidase